MQEDVLEILKSCVLLCSDAYMDIDDTSMQYVPCGGPIEKCLLTWLNDINTPVYDKIVQKQKEFTLKTKIPFNPTSKKMTVVY